MQVRLLKFGAEWCQPCKAANIVLSQMDEKLRHNGVTVQHIDIDEDTATARTYNVRSIPHFVLETESGEEVWTHTGTLTSKTLTEALNDAPLQRA